jgi:hypothetical protein
MGDEPLLGCHLSLSDLRATYGWSPPLCISAVKMCIVIRGQWVRLIQVVIGLKIAYHDYTPQRRDLSNTNSYVTIYAWGPSGLQMHRLLIWASSITIYALHPMKTNNPRGSSWMNLLLNINTVSQILDPALLYLWYIFLGAITSRM